MRKKDIFLVRSIIFLVIIFFICNKAITKNEEGDIEIYIDNKKYKTISVENKEDFIIGDSENFNHIKIHNNGVEIIDASCKDKVCVNTGLINKSSERIVCLPNKVVIKIKALDNDNNKDDIISE